MTDLLDRVRAELQDRLEASRGAVQEYDRLQAALVALGNSDHETATPSRANHAPAGRKPARASTRRRGRASEPRKRAPRGQNRERVLAAVNDRPGVTTLELASVTGVKGGTLYTLLRRMVDEGVLARRELPGGDTGYTISDGA